MLNRLLKAEISECRFYIITEKNEWILRWQNTGFNNIKWTDTDHRNRGGSGAPRARWWRVESGPSPPDSDTDPTERSQTKGAHSHLQREQGG